MRVVVSKGMLYLVSAALLTQMTKPAGWWFATFRAINCLHPRNGAGWPYVASQTNHTHTLVQPIDQQHQAIATSLRPASSSACQSCTQKQFTIDFQRQNNTKTPSPCPIRLTCDRGKASRPPRHAANLTAQTPPPNVFPSMHSCLRRSSGAIGSNGGARIGSRPLLLFLMCSWALTTGSVQAAAGAVAGKPTGRLKDSSITNLMHSSCGRLPNHQKRGPLVQPS